MAKLCPHTFVIPAKAGIQTAPPTETDTNWAPAFAGATTVRVAKLCPALP